MRLRLLAATAVVVAVPFSAAAAQATRDSAGIHITDNAGPLLRGARALRISALPILELDADKGFNYDFGGVAGAVRLSNGFVLVAARSGAQFRLFDRSGRLLQTLNEHGAPHRVVAYDHTLAILTGDTVVAAHQRLVTMFALVGDSLTQVDAGSSAPSGAPRGIRVSTFSNGSGAFFGFPAPSEHAIGAQWVDSTGVMVQARDASLIRDLGRMPYVTFEMTKTGPSTVWLSAIGAPCAGPGGFYYGFGSEFAIHAYSEQGVPKAIIRRAWKPKPVTDNDWEHWVVEWSRIWVTERGADSLPAVQRVREEPWAEQLPAFAACLVARDGKLWVREAHLDDAISAGSFTDDPIVPSIWSVFDTSGRWLNDVTMPARFRPTDIGGDYVMGRSRMGPGRMKVVMYRLGPGAR
ncbi:MAG: hypothetical protein ABIZ70_02850 [Gemmatimonadales bacterium]